MDGDASLIKLFARAKVLDNYILVKEGGREFRARPLGWDKKGFVAKLRMQFTLTYFLYENDKLLSKIRYDDVRDLFIIEKNEVNPVEIFIKPSQFSFGRRKYRIENTFRGIEIIDATEGVETVAGIAKFGFTSYSIEFEIYPPGLEEVIKEIAVMYVVKRIVWSMIGPI